MLVTGKALVVCVNVAEVGAGCAGGRCVLREVEVKDCRARALGLAEEGDAVVRAAGLRRKDKHVMISDGQQHGGLLVGLGRGGKTGKVKGREVLVCSLCLAFSGKRVLARECVEVGWGQVFADSRWGGEFTHQGKRREKRVAFGGLCNVGVDDSPNFDACPALPLNSLLALF